MHATINWSVENFIRLKDSIRKKGDNSPLNNRSNEVKIAVYFAFKAER